MPSSPPPDSASAPAAEATAPTPALTRTLASERRFLDEANTLGSTSARVSFLRLVAFLAAVVGGISAATGGGALGLYLAIGGTLACAVLLGVHARLLGRQRQAELRAAVHHDHVLRMTGRASQLPAAHDGLLPGGHPYAIDIDLVGPASLLQRLDAARTLLGTKTLARWLGAPATEAEILARQGAVRELAALHDFRQELEAAGRLATGNDKLDAAPFLAFTKRAPRVLGTPLVVLIVLSPLVLLGLYIAGRLGLVPSLAFWVAFALQALLALGLAKHPLDVFELIAARRGYIEAYASALACVEAARFEDPLLQKLHQDVHAGGTAPSSYMRRLDRWAGLAEFRHQFPVHFFVNLFTLWDLHVLLQLERWNRSVGTELERVFAALGELEALSSLGSFLDSDPDASFPRIVSASEGYHAEGLAHPLLPASARVPNDVTLGGPGHALIITGSNMAGKSTLLRAVGLNTALALAGGPVLAQSLSLPVVRLRASMRVDDSLQKGASYFHAELAKLRSVVAGADSQPPLLFLLDELLRGTNARARHLGARAVLTHLLDRGALGLAATHDIALSELEHERVGEVTNVHFTDVMDGDEMIFDYRLREGVVKTSNALRLLGMAGIAVPDDDRVDSL
ncbi:MAG: DNA mismatch repair protein MutS [Sandaracinaceae bacterium]|nr:DNA mismatch repair protein MutS [Sandaracinaceae bacterium]